MPHLRLETATPTETEKTIAELKSQLKERDEELNALKETIAKIQPLVEFVNSFNAPKQLNEILDFLKDDFASDLALSKDHKLYASVEWSSYIKNKLDRIAKRKGITPKEALEH